ncbi:DUF5694 domain-containing protein [Lewinella sp. IMCC34191]|uniref:DUF5694 domain-containing protein n=1 Tax=Lewinella sp. IMCC34191 TaxID=2259172 RepID=UPI000E21DFE9|nr:DUF5694 domain-containing protein [Lewinella sp. IMCC34191]
MPRFLALLFIVVYGSYALAQHAPDLQSFDPDDVLVVGDNLPKVLLVGTFHFDYPNLDAHVTSAEDRVDVKDAQRQAEVRELLDYLARFRPNKIVVERQPGSSVNDQYRSYLAGERELRADEIEQLAFRLGKQFGMDSLVLGDASPLSYTLSEHPDSAILHPLLDSIFADGQSDNAVADTINSRYFQLYQLEDRMDTQQSLLEIFRYNNRPDRIRRGHGHYLQFTSDRSADALALWWYSRNLRIFRNIQRAATSPDDRILVLFGAGHLGILRQQLESTPAMQLVEFGDL